MLEEAISVNKDAMDRVAANADYIVLDSDHLTVRTTLDITTSLKYIQPMISLSSLARSACRDIDPSNDLLVLRVVTRKNEVMAYNDKEFSVIALQKKPKPEKRFG